MFTKILVAIDNFTDSQPVFEQALELAKLTDARLMVLHVLSAQDQDYPALQSNALEAYQQQWHHFKAHSLKQLRSLAQQAAAAGITTEVSQTFGDPGNGICDLSRTWKADLIIVGSRDHLTCSKVQFGLRQLSN